MPVSNPPPYSTRPVEFDAVAYRPDSLVIARQRLQREPAVANPLARIAEPAADAGPSLVEGAPQVFAEADIVVPRRRPAYLPTEAVHYGLPAASEKQKDSDLSRFIRKLTLTEKRYTPEEKSEQVVQWLVTNEFFVRQAGSNRATQRPIKFYNHDAGTSKLFEGYSVNIAKNMPWLKPHQIKDIRTMLIDRSHAVYADSTALGMSTQECLVRYFKSIEPGKSLVAIGELTAKDGKKLTRLSCMHMDDVFFDPSQPVDRGGMGQFFAGVTKRNHPVGIKRVTKQTKAGEAFLMRKLTAGGYLQVHKLDQPWLVMPLYSTNLEDAASAFFNVPYTSRTGTGGGLIGVRYVWQKLAEELVVLHEQMSGIHADFKAKNLFVDKAQQRILPGDFGISAMQSKQGSAPATGHTIGCAAPEQLINATSITPAVDIFSAAANMSNLILRYDPHFKRLYQHKYPDKPFHRNLLDSEKARASESLLAWIAFNEPRDQDIVGERLSSHGQGDHTSHYARKFARIDAVMTELDAPLWQTMRAALASNPKKRPIARKVLHLTKLNDADEALAKLGWEDVPVHSEAIAKSLANVRASLKAK